MIAITPAKSTPEPTKAIGAFVAAVRSTGVSITGNNSPSSATATICPP
jgi:hypothetical protein